VVRFHGTSYATLLQKEGKREGGRRKEGKDRKRWREGEKDLSDRPLQNVWSGLSERGKSAHWYVDLMRTRVAFKNLLHHGFCACAARAAVPPPAHRSIILSIENTLCLERTHAVLQRTQ
jgi:hypothetical protein